MMLSLILVHLPTIVVACYFIEKGSVMGAFFAGLVVLTFGSIVETAVERELARRRYLRKRNEPSPFLTQTMLERPLDED